MLRRLRPPSAATVIAFIALMVALGPHAYAAVRSLVGTKQLRNGAVTSPKLHNGAVTAKKLAAGAVRSAAIAKGAVGAAQLAPGMIAPGADLSQYARKGGSYTKGEADALGSRGPGIQQARGR